MVASIIATRTRSDWVSILAAKGVPCAEFNSIPEALASEQVKAVGIAGRSPVTGRQMCGLPFTIDGRRPANLRNSPAVGEHNSTLIRNEADPALQPAA